MKQFSYTVQDHMGIHARPAGLIVKLAKGLNSMGIFGLSRVN